MAVQRHDINLGDVNGICPDLSIIDGDLRAEFGLETAVIISLFTDRFITEDDLPQGQQDVRGWWADGLNTDGDLIGSVFWALERSKITTENLQLWKDATEQALQWMLDDGIAAQVIVEVGIG